MITVGIADTTFARVNMADFVIDVIKKNSKYKIERYTVPGIKDLPVACKILFKKYKADIVIAMGMAGPKAIDKQCSHEASTGLQSVQLTENKHILEVFVHVDEASNDNELYQIAKNRAEKHALNAIALLKGKTSLSKFAGTGKRQGKDDESPIRI